MKIINTIYEKTTPLGEFVATCDTMSGSKIYFKKGDRVLINDIICHISFKVKYEVYNKSDNNEFITFGYEDSIWDLFEIPISIIRQDKINNLLGK